MGWAVMSPAVLEGAGAADGAGPGGLVQVCQHHHTTDGEVPPLAGTALHSDQVRFGAESWAAAPLRLLMALSGKSFLPAQVIDEGSPPLIAGPSHSSPATRGPTSVPGTRAACSGRWTLDRRLLSGSSMNGGTR